MNELEKKIVEIMGPNTLGYVSLMVVNEFIEKCSISDFEKLKDLEYDLNQKDND